MTCQTETIVSLVDFSCWGSQQKIPSYSETYLDETMSCSEMEI